MNYEGILDGVGDSYKEGLTLVLSTQEVLLEVGDSYIVPTWLFCVGSGGRRAAMSFEDCLLQDLL